MQYWSPGQPVSSGPGCDRLTRDGGQVIAAGRSSRSGPWSEFRQMDLREDLTRGNLLAGVETIFHLAGKAHAVSEKSDDASGYGEIIVNGTRRLLEAAVASGVRRFIYVSSVKAMGEGNPSGEPLRPINEEWPLQPQSPYGIAKAEAEQLVRDAGLAHAAIVRPVMVFGDGDKGNLPRMVEAVRKGRFPPLPDSGNKRSMVHVDDVVEAMIRSCQTPAAGRTYILAGRQAPSTRQLYDAIRHSLGMPPVHWSVPHWVLKSAAVLGTGAKRSLGVELGLDLTVLEKLTGSAWYESTHAKRDLGYEPLYGILDWLAENRMDSGLKDLRE